MIAKEIAAPRGESSFTGLVAYLTSSQGRAERVGRIEVSNCVSADHQGAVLEVLNTQARNHRAAGKTYHLVVSFRQGEQPAVEVLQAIEERVCTALGFSGHQRVSVVHEDTDNLHLHVAINRVHPDKLTAHSPSFSKLVLDRECVMLERDFGLAPDHHQYLEREQELLRVEQLRQNLVQQRQQLHECASWAQLHELAAQHGVVLRLRGRGLSFVDGAGHAVRASSVSRALSKAALEKRLGPFEPGHASAATAAEELSQPQQPESRRAVDMELLSDGESLIGFIRRRCGDGLQQAGSWAALHELAGAHGLELKLRGNGLVIVSGAQAVKASSVSRALSKGALEKRLGPFEARPDSAPIPSQYARRPLGESSGRLYQRYQQHRQQAQLTRQRGLARLQEDAGRERTRVQARSQRRWAAVKLMSKGRVAAAIWAAEARRAARRDLEGIERDRRAAAARMAKEQPLMGWVQWLRAEAQGGDAEALAALRRRSGVAEPAGNHLYGAARGESRPLSAAIESVTSGGQVTYRVQGGRVRDDGQRLCLDAGAAQGAAAQLLRLAKARYGARLGVRGDADFKEQLAWAAASEGIEVTFADGALEQRRQHLWEELSYVRGRRADDRAAAGRVDERAGPERSSAPQRTGPTAGRAGLGEPHPFVTRAGPAPQPRSGVRSVSEVDVVRFGSGAEGLLPSDARGDLDQRRPTTDRAVRRGDAGRAVDKGKPRGRSR